MTSATITSRQLEDALADGLRSQGLDVEDVFGTIIAKLWDEQRIGLGDCVTLNVTRLARDVDRYLS